jgi:hypothetical protein
VWSLFCRLLSATLNEAVVGSGWRSFSQVISLPEAARDVLLVTSRLIACRQVADTLQLTQCISMILLTCWRVRVAGSSSSCIRGQGHQSHLPGLNRQERQLPHRAGAFLTATAAVLSSKGGFAYACAQHAGLTLPARCTRRPSPMARKWWAEWCPRREAAHTWGCRCTIQSVKQSRRQAAMLQSFMCHHLSQQQQSWSQ